MSRTITAMFDSRSEAEAARDQLRSTIGADARIIDKSSTSSGTAGESRGFWADLKDIFVPDEDRYSYEEGVRRGGFLLCANVDEAQADRACSILESSRTVDFDSRERQWRSEGWTGYPGQRETTGGRDFSGERGKIVEEERIPLVEEQLRVGKREVNRGGARVRSYVEERPVRESVNLREEHVNVERRPVDRRVPTSELDKGDLLRERNVEMTETAEKPVVGKEARVKEEVVLRKTARQRKAEVQDTVRRTDVDIEEPRPDDDRTAFGFDKEGRPIRKREPDPTGRG